jgi:hypothetical protein
VRRGYAALARAHVCVCGTFLTTKRERPRRTHTLSLSVSKKKEGTRYCACLRSIAFIRTSIEEEVTFFFAYFLPFFSSLKIEEVAAEHSLLSQGVIKYRDINKNVDRIRQRRRDSGEADARERRARDHGKYSCLYFILSVLVLFFPEKRDPSEFSLVVTFVLLLLVLVLSR